MTDAAQGDQPESYPVEETTVAFRSGRVIEVHTDTVRLPSGDRTTRDVVVHPGAVGVVALDDEDRVLLVQQYRHPVRHRLWEPPAGILDQPGEEPLAAAQRELQEEAGYRADTWDTLVDAFTSPGSSSESIRIYLARGLHRDGETAGEHEEKDMPVDFLPLDRAAALVLDGGLHNPMAVMGVLAAARAQASGFSGLRPADAPWPQQPTG